MGWIEKNSSVESIQRVGLKILTIVVRYLEAKSLCNFISKEVLWMHILIDKYIAPDSLMECIQHERKIKGNVLIERH